MRNFWKGFAKVCVRVGLWASQHPEVIQIIEDSLKKS
jgi:hypothetical protein